MQVKYEDIKNLYNALFKLKEIRKQNTAWPEFIQLDYTFNAIDDISKEESSSSCTDDPINCVRNFMSAARNVCISAQSFASQKAVGEALEAVSYYKQLFDIPDSEEPQEKKTEKEKKKKKKKKPIQDTDILPLDYENSPSPKPQTKMKAEGTLKDEKKEHKTEVPSLALGGNLAISFFNNRRTGYVIGTTCGVGFSALLTAEAILQLMDTLKSTDSTMTGALQNSSNNMLITIAVLAGMVALGSLILGITGTVRDYNQEKNAMLVPA